MLRVHNQPHFTSKTSLYIGRYTMANEIALNSPASAAAHKQIKNRPIPFFTECENVANVKTCGREKFNFFWQVNPRRTFFLEVSWVFLWVLDNFSKAVNRKSIHTMKEYATHCLIYRYCGIFLKI